MILIAVLIVIAAVSLTAGVMSLLRGEPGWRKIEAAGSELNCSRDFVFNYYLEENQTGQSRAITALYSSASEKAYWLFTGDQTRESERNVCYLNRHPNEAVPVDPVLYDAFARLEGTRNLYLAPAAAQYDSLFYSESVHQAENRDPRRNPDQMAWFRELAAFAGDPAQVQLELLEDSCVRLRVSDAYLAFAEENGIRDFIDFGWMKNAFIIDYFAALMQENGYTRGYFASVDGFTRNLDDTGAHYSFNIFDRVENGIYLAARMDYTGPMSLVSLRAFPINQTDSARCYLYPDGTAVTSYLDPKDGLSKAALPALTGYAPGKTCAELALSLSDVYLAEDLSPEKLMALPQQGIQAVWCQDQTVRHTDPALTLYDLLREESLTYASQWMQP